MDKTFADAWDKARGYEIGMRVGAILGTQGSNKIVTFLGYGKYNGQLPCEALGGLPNPNITLDNGEVVWGCECWWGKEDQIEAKLSHYKDAGYEIETVSIVEERRKHEIPSES
jgi:hypothetical protein